MYKNGVPIPDRIYTNSDYDYNIVIEDRIQQVAREITQYLKATDRMAKTIVFCANEDAAERMRQALVNLNADMVKQFPYMLCITNMLLHDLDVPRVFHDNTLLRDVLDYTEDDRVSVILMNPPYGGSEKADVKNHFPADWPPVKRLICSCPSSCTD